MNILPRERARYGWRLTFEHVTRGGARASRALAACAVLGAVSFATDASADPTSGAARGAGESTNPEGRVEVAGVSGADSATPRELSTTVEAETFEYRIGVVEVDRRPVKEVALAVEPLLDTNGRQYRVRWGVSEQLEQDYAVIAAPFGASTRNTVVFRATLPDLGAYTTTITPYWAGVSHQKILLRVTRTLSPLDLSLSEPAVFAQDGNTGAATFALTAHETAGRPLKLNEPVLDSLVESHSVGATDVALTRTAKLGPGDCKTPSSDRTHANGQVPIDVPPNGSKRLELCLEGLPGPGKFEATLEFGAPGATALRKVVTLYVRAHFFWAGVCIALGVGISFLLRWWVSKAQPRLELQAQASRLTPDLDAALRPSDLDADERTLGDSVRQQLAQLLSDISNGVAAANGAAIDSMAQRVAATRNWIALHRTVRLAPEEVAGAFLDRLKTINDVLSDQGAEAALLKEQLVTLRSLSSELNVAVRKQGLKVQMHTLEGEMSPTNFEALKQDVDARFARGDLDGAAERIRQERDAVVTDRARKAELAGAMMGPEEIETKRAILAHNPFRGFSTPVLEQAIAFTNKQLRRGMWTEAAINVTILLIAVVLGMKALYLDDLVWGGWADAVTAFLWGLGLHQFTYGGIGSVLDRVAKGGAA